MPIQKIRSLVVLLIITFAVVGCSHKKETSEQKKNEGTSDRKAQIFAPGVISSGHAYGISFSEDLKTCFFTYRKKHQSNGSIYTSSLTNGSWSEPQKASFSSEFEEYDPNITPDFKYMFIMTNRPIQGSTAQDNFDIWYLERSERDWVNPKPLAKSVNSPASEGVVSVTNDGWMYFFSSREGGHGRSDIYKARFEDGKVGDVQNIGPEINSEHWEGHNYLTPDGKVLLFYSNKPDDTFGRGDLYVSYNTNGKWSKPENLGSNVNSELPEITPYISPDMKYLYFGRIHDEDLEGTDEKLRSIWFIPIEDTPIKL